MNALEVIFPDLSADCLSHLGAGAPQHHAFPGSSCADWMESTNGPAPTAREALAFGVVPAPYEPHPACLG